MMIYIFSYHHKLSKILGEKKKTFVKKQKNFIIIMYRNFVPLKSTLIQIS